MIQTGLGADTMVDWCRRAKPGDKFIATGVYQVPGAAGPGGLGGFLHSEELAQRGVYIMGK